MSWLEVRLTVDSPAVEAVEEQLFGCGAQAVTLLDAGDEPIHEPGPGETPLWPVSVVQALFPGDTSPAEISRMLQNAGLVRAPVDLAFDKLEDRDWTRAWMDRFKPMRFGRNLWICPSHLEPDPAWETVIRLDPGLAFGTGTHPTTALCLEWMDSQDFAGRSVVDYGCGSGVLAIAAALKGAERVVAIDHDPQALEATLDNARRNGVADALDIFLPDQAPDTRVDVVLANILAGPLMSLAPRLTGLVRPGGWLVVSGLLDEQETDVAACYLDAFDPQVSNHREGWSALGFRRRTS